MRKVLGFLAVVAIFAMSCGGSKTSTPNFTLTDHQVLVKGEILQIMPVKSTANPPCNTHHCMAKVKILEVGQTGPNYDGTIKPGNMVMVKFVFTLDGNKNKKLKKLQVGDQFQAPMTVIKKGQRYHFSVSMYQKL